ncbi:MAG: hypothetical protein OXN27_08590 [Candidatus Poribacteria bacterium]|nr:hypothetical protein [Candidatus Poribacteria bacterium]MDE0323969.1 hypothetical protein [Candidatus Poribacteria bacterium]
MTFGKQQPQKNKIMRVYALIRSGIVLRIQRRELPQSRNRQFSTQVVYSVVYGRSSGWRNA